MNIDFAPLTMPEDGALCVFAFADAELTASAKAADEKMEGALTAALKNARFDGKRGTVVEILAPRGLSLSRLLVAGLGEAKSLTAVLFEGIAGTVAGRLLRSGETRLRFAADEHTSLAIEPAVVAAHLAAGARLRSYSFDKYRTKEPETKKISLETTTVLSAAHEAAAARYAPMEQVIGGVFLTRDLVSEPANTLTPAAFAAEIAKLKDVGVDVEILDEADLEKIGMRALLGVGQGSAQESHVAIMRWNGSPANTKGGAKEAPLALVGKGVTFDSGGISLKPGEGMEEMKWDMGGAGIVTGAMKALALRGAKANVVGIVGLVENMPSATAQRPGDVVTSLSGQTIEIHNTDAEGRLVLADILWYCQDRFKPRAMIDLATLTGAMIITLGRTQMAGMFTDSDRLADQLTKAGQATGDRVWRLPLGEEYDRLIDSQIADMKNVGGRPAGSITAAQFLKRFTNNVPWVHLDVAGAVWALKDGKLFEKGATGYGVRLLDRFVADNYEPKG